MSTVTITDTMTGQTIIVECPAPDPLWLNVAGFIGAAGIALSLFVIAIVF